MLSESTKKEVTDKFLDDKPVEVLTLIGELHADMCRKNISIDKMQQCYMHVFNGIYRALKENDRVDDEIKGLMLKLFEDFAELKEQQALLDFVRALLEKLFGSLHRLDDERANIHLQKALNYIDKHYARNISMAEVANHIGVSYGYLSYILNESVEGGFVRILRNKRIEEAKKLLKYSDMKIYDIAEQCGFANSRYFGTMFYADTGLTPTQYRTQNYKENSAR